MKIAVIDVDHVFFICLTGEKILDENGLPIKVDNKFTYRERTFEESCNIADNYITNILNLTNATHYVGFFGGSSMSRKTIYPEYKANRKDLEPLKNMYEMKVHLADKWKFHWLSGCIDETDDLVASFIKQTPNSFIVSPDKDLHQISTILSTYDPKKNVWVPRVTPELEVYYLFRDMVIGQNGDNIKGLVGKGLSFWEKEIDNYNKKYSYNTSFLPQEVLNMYMQHYKYNYDLAIKEFYKNYMCLKIKDDLIIDSFKPIEWNMFN